MIGQQKLFAHYYWLVCYYCNEKEKDCKEKWHQEEHSLPVFTFESLLMTQFELVFFSLVSY